MFTYSLVAPCSAWRHWGCVTPKIITNMKKSFDEADELDGFDELKDEDKEKQDWIPS